MGTSSVMGLDEQDGAELLAAYEALEHPAKTNGLSAAQVCHAISLRVYTEWRHTLEGRTSEGIHLKQRIDAETHTEMLRRGFAWVPGRGFVRDGHTDEGEYHHVRRHVEHHVHSRPTPIKDWIDKTTHEAMTRGGYEWSEANYQFFRDGAPAGEIYALTRKAAIAAIAERGADFFATCSPHRMLPRDGGTVSLRVEFPELAAAEMERETTTRIAQPPVTNERGTAMPTAA